MIPASAWVAAGASLAVALAIALIVTPLVGRWATRRGWVDHPHGHESHKTHHVPTPLGGGIAILLAIVVPMGCLLLAATLATREAMEGPGWMETVAPLWQAWAGGAVQKMPQALAIIGGGIMLHLVGLLDDRRPLTARAKLIVQCAVALVLTAGFGIRSGEALGAIPAILLTSLWIVALTNAFNFLDNMDGLTAGVAALSGFVLAVSSLLVGQVFVPCLLLLIVGAALGFLWHNFPPASIFMGDAGSLVLGYFLAVSAVLTTYYDPELQRTPFGVLVPLVVFAVPLYDMGSVVINRFRRGVSIFASDRHHFSHRLVRLGMSRRLAVLTIYLATAATALPAMLLPYTNWAGATVIVAQCACVLALIAILESRDGPW